MNDTLELLANLAEILAGLAIIFSVIKLWPTFGEMVAARRTQVVIPLEELLRISREINSIEGVKTPNLKNIKDLIQALLSATVHLRGSDLTVSHEIIDGHERGSVRLNAERGRFRLCTFSVEWIRLIIDELRSLETAGGHRIRFKVGRHQFDARIVYQETMSYPYATLRILDPLSAQIPIEQLNIPDDTQSKIDEVLTYRQGGHGLVIFGGPTGSGKTVICYSHLTRAVKQGAEIASIEDPVEVDLPGIRQLPVIDEDGYRFTDRMTAIYSSGLDYLMIGEIRDAMTAEGALRFANSVGMTITTSSADSVASNIVQLHQLAPDSLWRGSFDSPRLVVNQRLMRRLCPACKTREFPSADDREMIRHIYQLNNTAMPENVEISKPKGCENCRDGYQGRVAAYESSYIDPEMEQICLQIDEAGIRETVFKVRDAAISAGMQTIGLCSLQRAFDAETSLDEIRRVISRTELP